MPASAYLTVHGGRLYVGSFDEEDPGSVYERAAGRRRAAVGAAGLRGHRPAALAGPCGGPTTGTCSARSWGRENPSELVSISHSGRVEHLTAPNMSEGLVIVNGQVYVVYESGASAYQYDGNHPGDHVTITPLDALR